MNTLLNKRIVVSLIIPTCLCLTEWKHCCMIEMSVVNLAFRCYQCQSHIIVKIFNGITFFSTVYEFREQNEMLIEFHKKKNLNECQLYAGHFIWQTTRIITIVIHHKCCTDAELSVNAPSSSLCINKHKNYFTTFHNQSVYVRHPVNSSLKCMLFCLND